MVTSDPWAFPTAGKHLPNHDQSSFGQAVVRDEGCACLHARGRAVVFAPVVKRVWLAANMIANLQVPERIV
jgi:hypothetical protein